MEAVKVIIKRIKKRSIALKNKELRPLTIKNFNAFPLSTLYLIKKALPKMGGLF